MEKNRGGYGRFEVTKLRNEAGYDAGEHVAGAALCHPGVPRNEVDAPAEVFDAGMQAEKTEDSMSDMEKTAEENEFKEPSFADSDGEVQAASVESAVASSIVADSVALDAFMGSEGFSDPSICEGNRSYSQEELEEQRRAKEKEGADDGSESTAGVGRFSPELAHDLVVDASEGGTSNDVVEDEEVFPSPFYSPLVEKEGLDTPSFDSFGEDDGGNGEFSLDADSIVPADMSDLDYDEDTGIRPAENSNESVAENENKGDNIDSIDDGKPEDTILADTELSEAAGISGTAGGTVEENTDTIPDAGEEQMDTNTNNQVSENTILIKQIAAELSTLRDEINDLKSEFEEFRNGRAAVSEPEIPEEEKESGFFSDMDDDDTIALSGDELSNILSTAEFTPAENHTEDALLGSVEGTAAVPDEEYDNNLQVNFGDEKLEEPNLDEVSIADGSAAGQEENLPNEIDVPKVDDAFDASASGEESFEEPVVEEESAPAAEENFEAPEVGTESEENAGPESEEIDRSASDLENENIDEQVDNTISQANYNYLAEEGENQDAAAEEDEKLETGISEDPVDGVFNKWEASSPAVDESVEEDFQEPVASEPASPAAAEESFEPAQVDEPVNEEPVAESIVSEPVPAAAEDNVSSSRVSAIPEEMKQEIKSVLAYMDQLLESLPEDKIAEFAQSEQFSTYKKLFNELGLS